MVFLSIGFDECCDSNWKFVGEPKDMQKWFRALIAKAMQGKRVLVVFGDAMKYGLPSTYDEITARYAKFARELGAGAYVDRKFITALSMYDAFHPWLTEFNVRAFAEQKMEAGPTDDYDVCW